jgi:hypothetical protein
VVGVDMFFPEDVKNRLMDSQPQKKLTTEQHDFRGGTPGSDDIYSGVSSDPSKVLDDKPIASLFSECTVIFADIGTFPSCLALPWKQTHFSPRDMSAVLCILYN